MATADAVAKQLWDAQELLKMDKSQVRPESEVAKKTVMACKEALTKYMSEHVPPLQFYRTRPINNTVYYVELCNVKGDAPIDGETMPLIFQKFLSQNRDRLPHMKDEEFARELSEFTLSQVANNGKEKLGVKIHSTMPVAMKVYELTRV